MEIGGFVGPRDATQIVRVRGKYFYLLSHLTSLKFISNVLQYLENKMKVQPVINMEFTLKTQSEFEVSNKKHL